MPVDQTHEVIVACVDGSPGAYAALAEAAELSGRFNATLIALSVEEGVPKGAAIMAEVDAFKAERDAYFEDVGARAEAIANQHHAKLTRAVRVGHAADVIVRFVDEVSADLVVLGYKEHSRLTDHVIRSTAHRVSARSKASVLIVKGANSQTGSEWSGSQWPRVVHLSKDPGTPPR